MSRELQLQADVGSLGLQGLGAFTSILATLSADNIVPMALIQMEKLGTNLPVSGKYAENVKGLLQRCKDTRLDHLALVVIGWRKNDSASLMAESAGGQAIALLSMCLTNLFNRSDTGIILARLSSKLCSHSANISSASQLADVAELLASKINALGFGNLLAEEVTRIHGIYHALGLNSAPAKLLEVLNVEAMIEILGKISQALCQEDKICRISGHRGMGIVIGLIKALFPLDLTLTVEGVVVQDVEHPKIRCEVIEEHADGLTQIRLETSISDTMPIRLPIENIDLTSNHVDSCESYTFSWPRWLADYLRLNFANYGVVCDRSIIEAFCDLLIHIPASLYVDATIRTSKNEFKEDIPTTSLLALLGPLPRARMCLVCENILGCTPIEHPMDLRMAFSNLRATITNAARGLACSCTASPCDWSEAWPYEFADSLKTRRKCPRFHLWKAIGCALGLGLWSFFIDVGPNATINPPNGSSSSWHATKALRAENGREILDARDLFESILQFIQGPGFWMKRQDGIITSSGSCTVYPAILENLEVPSHQLVTFKLAEGRIMFEHRYHRNVCAAEARARPKARRSLMDHITPSHVGVHSGSPLLTIREGFDFLELQASIRYARNETKLNFKQVILGYIGMRWTSMCTHPVTKPMDVFQRAPIATSIASPAASRRLGIAMTRWNPVAQFLCCENGYQAILQRECCLDCAAEMLGMSTNGVIIVG